MVKVKKLISEIKEEIVHLSDKNESFVHRINELETEKKILERKVDDGYSLNNLKELGLLKDKMDLLEKELNLCINLSKKI